MTSPRIQTDMVATMTPEDRGIEFYVSMRDHVQPTQWQSPIMRAPSQR
jgi:hypothetical protein